MIYTIFSQIREFEGFAATEPTAIKGIDGEGKPTPSREPEEAGLFERPAGKASSIDATVEMGEVLGGKNREGWMFCTDDLLFAVLMNTHQHHR